MKTPEDWKKVYDEIASEIRESGLFGLGLDKIHDEGFKKFVKAIQLDAARCGMRMAIDQSPAMVGNDDKSIVKHYLNLFKKNISCASEELTAKDL